MKQRNDRTKAEREADAFVELISKGNNKGKKPPSTNMTPQEKTMVKEMNEGVE